MQSLWVIFLERFMRLFEPQEIEIKTRRGKDELVLRLSKRAAFKGNSFVVESVPYGFGKTFVVGKIVTTDSESIVQLSIQASTFLKVFSYFWLIGLGCALVTFSIRSIMNQKYDSDIHLTFGLWTFGLIVSRLAFRFSSDNQIEVMRQLIKSAE